MLNRSEKLLLAATAGLVLLGGWIFATKGPGTKEPPAKADVKTASALDIPAHRALIDRLDFLFQERFQNIQENEFGLRRIARLEDIGTHRLWRNDPAVGKIAAQLNRKGVETYFQTVALMRGPTSWSAPPSYVYQLTDRTGVAQCFLTREEAQRQYAASPKEFGDGAIRAVESHPSLSMPIPITQAVDAASQSYAPSPPSGFPDFPQLRRGVDESVAALKTSSSHTFRAGDWAVLARPIRANGKCVSCHQGADGRRARPGDTLGLALYLVKAAPQDTQVAVQAPALSGRP